MNRLAIIRTKQDERETLGDSRVANEKDETIFSFKSMERPWKNNEHEISCIPAGRYRYIKILASNHIPYEHLLLRDVESREYICVHRMNFFTDSKGCIGVGERFLDLNHDGELDVTNSKATLDKILELLPQEGFVDIIENF